MQKRPTIMAIFGTRPETIKMAPLINRIQQYDHELRVCVVVTAQHRTMLDQMLAIFHLQPDYDLDIMLPGQTLTQITVRALTELEHVIQQEEPDLVLVQGDTTTAFVGGLAAYYHQIPVGHVEAGLRTHNKYNPYPEEINRHLLDVISDLCFAPTDTARQTLLAEGIPESRIIVTGNTVIDALHMSVARPHQFTLPSLQRIDFGSARRTLLVTLHRREHFGTPLETICLALRDLLTMRNDLQLVIPVHLNPRVRETVSSLLGDLESAILVDPLDYLDFVHLMQAVDIVVTDSGGVQEEAPALGKPVLVIRETTERPEAITAGTARLVGTNRENIIAAISQLLDNPEEYARMQHAVNPYGDGHAAERTTHAIRHFLGLVETLPPPFSPAPARSVPSTVHRSLSGYSTAEQ
jgi:UDP-N-acetylglucosamine 2-epimerase (non-hydrolysing)